MPKTKQAAPWQNRIVGYGEEAPDQLLANPQNWRIHPTPQQDQLGGVLKTVGVVQNIIVNRRTGFLVDGHLRVQLALRTNQPSIPVTYVDLDESEEALILATLDPLAALAATDQEQLDALLASVSTDDANVQALLDSLSGADAITPGLTDPDDVPPVPAEPITKPGDLWLLGKHRLLCGDSTVVTDVERLMAGERADMVFTDPPYGVSVGDKNKWLNTVSGSSKNGHLVGSAPKSSNRVTSNLENDTIDETALLQLLRDSFSLAATYCTAGASWYVAAPAGPLHLLWGQALNELGIFRQTIQWVKNNSTFSPMGVCYHWQAEPIFFGWLPNGAHRWFGDRTQTTVWEIDRPQKSPEHPTMKPVELVTKALQNSCDPGGIVLDMFLGSGTSIIAAEQTGRDCYGLELDPHYCDVIVQRYERFTGATATLECADLAGVA